MSQPKSTASGFLAFAASVGKPSIINIGSEIADPEEASVLMKPHAMPTNQKTPAQRYEVTKTHRSSKLIGTLFTKFGTEINRNSLSF